MICPHCGKEFTASARGQRLPADWKPTAQQVAWARAKRPLLDVAEEAEKFRDFWTAKSGKDATKLDWDATWRNWVRNARVSPGVIPHANRVNLTAPAPMRAERRMTDEQRARNRQRVAELAAGAFSGKVTT